MISLDISKCISFAEHRSGWRYCIDSLKPFHSRAGIYVDGFLEQSFAWRLLDYHWAKSYDDIPYEKEWVGFLHNPPDVPEWFDLYNSPQAIIERDVFQASLQSCRALITLSEYLGGWLKRRIDVPVISVKHPTESNVAKWKPENFTRESRPKVVMIGYWLRKMDSIFKLNAPYPFKKIWLPGNQEYSQRILKRLDATQKDYYFAKYQWAAVTTMGRLSNEEYDNMMTNSVVFLDMYDSSANNAVIECIARNTPLLVNRLPAVVEYCGEDYPLYFSCLEEAESILKDTDRIIAAHHHFKNMDKRWIDGSYFAATLTGKLSEVLTHE